MSSTPAVMSAIKSLGQATARYLPEPVASGVSFASSLLQGGVSGSSQTVDISANYQALIEKQIQVQLEQQQVSFTSNIERSQHESRMAAVRNLKLG